MGRGCIAKMFLHLHSCQRIFFSVYIRSLLLLVMEIDKQIAFIFDSHPSHLLDLFSGLCSVSHRSSGSRKFT